MTTDTNSVPNDEISLLDLLLVIAENLRLLVLGPLLVGALAFGVATALPPKFESVAVQSGDTKLAAMYNSAQVHSAIIKSTGYQQPGETESQARDRLAQNLKVSFDRTNGTVKVAAQATSPQAAQNIATAAIAAAGELNQKRLDDVTRLEEQFELATKRERDYSASAEALGKQLATANAESRAELSQAQSQLLNFAREAQVTTAGLAERLRQAQTFEIIQEPTLSDEKVSPKRSIITLAAALFTGFLLLLLVFVRHAFVSAAQNPESAVKVTALRQAWRKALGRA